MKNHLEYLLKVEKNLTWLNLEKKARLFGPKIQGLVGREFFYVTWNYKDVHCCLSSVRDEKLNH